LSSWGIENFKKWGCISYGFPHHHHSLEVSQPVQACSKCHNLCNREASKDATSTDELEEAVA